MPEMRFLPKAYGLIYSVFDIFPCFVIILLRADYMIVIPGLSNTNRKEKEMEITYV
jgi:hypothetical protein